LVLRALVDKPFVVPLRRGAASRTVASAEALGIFSYVVGTDIDVIDDHGLAEVVAAHQQLDGRGRPGHEKAIPDLWVFARFAAENARLPKGVTSEQVAAARQAMSCGGLDDLIQSTTGAWQPSDAGSNLVEAFRSFGFRFPTDPMAAVTELCGASSRGS
jgi:arabinofuranosyltransferase